MKTKSFTLIELLVVIVIIGILAGVIVVSTSSAIQKANFAKAQAFSSTVRNELFSDLVSEWTFNDVNNPGEDTAGDNDGVIFGNPSYQNKCVYGGCYSFNGSDDYIKTNLTKTLLLLKFTTSIWVKFNEEQDYRGIVELSGVAGYPSRIMTFPGKTVRFHPFYDSTNNDNFVETTILIGEWINFTGTFNGIEGKLYKNGSYIGSTTLIDPIAYSDNTYFTFGMDSGRAERRLNGFIDDVRIYNIALSSAQIKQEYVAGLNSLLANNNISKEEYLNRIENLSLND